MSKMNQKRMSAELLEKLNTLNETERRYFSMMYPKYGVLFITSKPGIGKSAIGESISDKMDYQYMDIRLSQSDESDFKYPYLTDVDVDGKIIKVSNYATPKWAYDANSKPTIIHFEELNRCSLPIRNACLQILLERRIGDFKFNDNVLMMASGNLGSEDGTDVEELDNALNNRLIHVSHTMSVNEWFEGFAIENIHPTIVSYIRANPEYMYKSPSENTQAYATPRSWTMLSEFIICNYGFDSPIEDFIDAIEKDAHSYIGNAAMSFLQYCRDMESLNINDIMNEFDKVKNQLLSYNRDKKSELLSALREKNIIDMSEKQMDNIESFLELVGDDEKTAYILALIDDKKYSISDTTFSNFILRFDDYLTKIEEVIEDSETKKEEEGN